MGALWIFISAFGFSTLSIFGQWAYHAGLTRNEALFLRFLFALPLYLLVLLVSKKTLRVQGGWGTLKVPILVGFFGIGLEATLYFMTLAEVGAALTGVLLYLYPSLIALIQHFIFKKRLRALDWVAVVLAFLGGVLVSGWTSGAVSVESTVVSTVKVTPYGMVLGFFMALCYAIYILVGDKILSQKQDPLTTSFGIAVGAMVAFLLFLGGDFIHAAIAQVVIHRQSVDVKLAMASVLGLAALSTVLPFATLYLGMAKIGATRTAIISTFEMVFTLILAALFLQERLTLLQAQGAFLVLLSVLLIELFKRK